MKQIIIYLETMKDSNLHLTTIRTVSSSCRCASIYTNRLFDFIMNEQFSLHFGFSELFLLTRLNIFTSACIDYSSFRCSPSAYLIRLAGFVVLRASFHQSHGAHCAIRLLLFPRHFLTDVSKNYFSILSEPLPVQDCRCPKTTYFIR